MNDGIKWHTISVPPETALDIIASESISSVCNIRKTAIKLLRRSNLCQIGV